MSRFYFHLVGKFSDRDIEGTELPSAAYAKREGLKLIGAMLNDGFYDTQGTAILLEITDESGLVLFHIDVTAWDAPVGPVRSVQGGVEGLARTAIHPPARPAHHHSRGL